MEGRQATFHPTAVVQLTALMEVSAGSPDIAVALIDGPVASDHPDLATENIRRFSPASVETPKSDGAATAHGTFVAGILAARRGSRAPAICPGCTLFVRPIFLESALEMPSATPDEAANAIADCVDAGVQIINLSVAVAQPSPNREPKLEEALNHAARRGTMVIAAAGNQGTIGSSAITRHTWVIPVAACDGRGQPFGPSNLGASIGRRGLRAPGESVTSLGTGGETVTSGGTSAAAPFVTGTAALLWSAFPFATAPEIKRAITRVGAASRTTIVPPLLNAWAAYQLMAAGEYRRAATG